jgi:hypothetical protein
MDPQHCFSTDPDLVLHQSDANLQPDSGQDAAFHSDPASQNNTDPGEPAEKAVLYTEH